MFKPAICTLTAATALAGLTLTLGACSPAAETPAPEAATAALVAATPAAPACDRQCLLSATDAYVAAIVAHDPALAPLAEDAVFVENITKMQPGEGLWQSVVLGPCTFALHVPAELNQSGGYLALSVSSSMATARSLKRNICSPPYAKRRWSTCKRRAPVF